MIKRYKLSILGSVALNIPLFGYFSFSMAFMFTGAGVLFVLWIPFIEYCPEILKLGDIVLVPLFPFFLSMLTPNDVLSFMYLVYLLLLFLIPGLGVTIFFFSTAEWFYRRLTGNDIIVSGIYRYSRHPQYLGFLLWSYGILLYAFPFSIMEVKPPLPTFFWLLNALVFITVALFEENKLIRTQNTEYNEWREKTPFMLPLPNFISMLLIKPVKVFLRKEWPENGRDIAFIILFYGMVLILLSSIYSTLLYEIILS
jgi:protein-S-isoprenylcysteine O-methyltransferase Ste14